MWLIINKTDVYPIYFRKFGKFLKIFRHMARKVSSFTYSFVILWSYQAVQEFGQHQRTHVPIMRWYSDRRWSELSPIKCRHFTATSGTLIFEKLYCKDRLKSLPKWPKLLRFLVEIFKGKCGVVHRECTVVSCAFFQLMLGRCRLTTRHESQL